MQERHAVLAIGVQIDACDVAVAIRIVVALRESGTVVETRICSMHRAAARPQEIQVVRPRLQMLVRLVLQQSS